MSRKPRSKSMKQLPADWQPTPFSVLCGRGRGIYNNSGNQKFRDLVSRYLQDYVKASGQAGKSKVVKNVLTTMLELCPVGAFIKLQDGRYYELGRTAAHDKCSATFRDLLNAQTRSNCRAIRAQQTLMKVSHTASAPSSPLLPPRALLTPTVSDYTDDSSSGSSSENDDDDTYSHASVATDCSVGTSVSASFFDVDTLDFCQASFVENDVVDDVIPLEVIDFVTLDYKNTTNVNRLDMSLVSPLSDTYCCP